MQNVMLNLIGGKSSVEGIADDLHQIGVSVDLNLSFEAQGFDAPLISFDPTPMELPNPKLVGFHSACRRMASQNGRIKACDFDVEAVSHLSDYLMMLDVEQDGQVFRYSYYGDAINNFRGLGMLGRTSDFFSGHISRFFTATYRAAWLRKVPVFTIHEPPKRVFVSAWKRLIIPLFNEHLTDVVRFAVLNVPDNDLRAGLDVVPDPVVVADRDMVLRYANLAATKMFGSSMQFGARLNVTEFAGLDLDIPESPETLAGHGAVRDMASIALRGHMIQRFFVTVSGLVMNKRAFYVISLRPAFEDMNCKFH